MIVLELQKYRKRFRAFSYIFGSALRLTYIGSYHIVQHCFSEWTSRLRAYFKNIQFWLFIRLVWSSDDVSRVYGSSGHKTLDFKLWDVFRAGPTLPFLIFAALGTVWFPYKSPHLSLFSLSRLVYHSLTFSPTSHHGSSPIIIHYPTPVKGA